MSTAGLLILVVASAASPAALECPAITGQTLVFIDIYDGPPEHRADLAPDETKQQRGITSNLWQLRAGADGLFVKCGYGRKLEGLYSRVEMIRLPDTVKTCRADFEPGAKPADLTLQKFSCR